MAITLRPNRKPANGPAMPRPVPYTRDELEAHYFPPQPPNTVIAHLHGRQVLHDRIAALTAERDQLRAARRDAVTRLAAAAVKGERLDDLIADGVQIDGRLALLDLQHQLVVAAHRELSTSMLLAQRIDPVYVAWTAQCQRIRHEWYRALTAHGSGNSWEESQELQEQAIESWALRAAAQLDAEAAAR